ncbi:aminopeptidase N, partial [Thiolapillus sp.]
VTRTAGAQIGCQRPSRFWGLGCPKIYHEAEDTLVVDPVDNREYFFSHFEPFWANRLFPCFDQPDLKASFSVTVEAPDDWQIISNTLATKTGNGDLSRHEFARSRRFSTYLFALVGGPFAVFEDRRARIPSRLFSTQSMSAYVDAENIFEVTRQGFDFYGKYFGIPYPFGKYDQIFVPHFNAGAMENVAAVVIKEDAYLYRETPLPSRMQKRANTILHEMAHMWFGDIVTMRWWNDLWLNESFATFMSYLAQVEGTPDKHAWQQFSSSMKNWAYWQDQLPTTHPIETRVEDTLSTFDNFDGITYGKGASVLKQLAFYVGSEAFRKGVSSYLKKHAWKNAERKDFTDAIGQAAGMNLDGWTKLWLQKSGINTLVADYDVDAQGRISRFELLQGKGNGDAVLRPHRLQVALFHDREGKPGLEKTVTVNVTGERTAVDDLVGEPAPDFVYPNYGDHAYAKFYLDDRSMAYARRHLDLLPASVRPGIWSTLWFMVQDGRLSPSTYMAIFLDMAPRGNDARQLSSFRWKLNTLLDQYLNQAVWRDAMERLHAVA